MALKEVNLLLDSQLEDKNEKYAGKFFPLTIKCLKLAASNADKDSDRGNAVKIFQICEKAIQDKRIYIRDMPNLLLN